MATVMLKPQFGIWNFFRRPAKVKSHADECCGNLFSDPLDWVRGQFMGLLRDAFECDVKKHLDPIFQKALRENKLVFEQRLYKGPIIYLDRGVSQQELIRNLVRQNVIHQSRQNKKRYTFNNPFYRKNLSGLRDPEAQRRAEQFSRRRRFPVEFKPLTEGIRLVLNIPPSKIA